HNAQGQVASFEADAGPWTVEYYPSTQKTLVKDGLNNTWDYRHDATTGITTQITEPTGGVHQLTLDADNNPLSFSGPESLTSTWTYNSLGQPLTYNPPDAGSNSITYTYSGQDVSSVTTLDGGLTTFTRDSAGRITQQIPPDAGKWTATYNVGGDRLTLRLPQGNEFGGSGHEWSFTYDTYGNVLTATDPTDRVFEFEYTAHGDLWKFRRPDHLDGSQVVMSEWIYDRDAAGKITAVTDPLGSTWTRE
ncbi:MAG: hypothetical protein GY708_22595, partial [Actinomycetia bacterium]|nr:hypothetical protein [Actinomycetes bacterium]